MIHALGVSKTFHVPEDRRHTLKERALHPRTRANFRHFQALRDLNFSVAPGEFFGIAGRNGSGKSTLLKCIAGIYRADGRIWRRGRMSTMIELGVGFNMELPARDNVILNGIMMGLTPREARRRVDEVIEFAELEEFTELKVKNYSSGMIVRLAFSVAIQVDAELMLVDEILAVGDASFQQKCFDVFNRMRDAGKTVVFVTHDMGSLMRFCHRAMLLEHGEMIEIGDPQDIADRYLEINFGRDAKAARSGLADDAHAPDADARVVEVWVEDSTGERRSAVGVRDRVTLKARVRFNTDVEDPAAAIYVHNEEQKAVFIASTDHNFEQTGSFRAGEEAIFSFSFENVLAPGRYSPIVNLAHRGVGLNVIDRFDSGFTFLVTSSRRTGGMIDLPVQVTVDRPSDRFEISA